MRIFQKQIMSVLLISLVSIYSVGAKASEATNDSYHAYIRSAQTAAKHNEPARALQNFRQALKLSDNDPVKKRVAIFGIAKMQNWLQQCAAAETNYRELLNQPLSVEDRKIAFEGSTHAHHCYTASLFREANDYMLQENYKAALAVYTVLLELRLNATEHELALNGYVRSLSALDRPMKAYRSIPQNYQYTTPVFVVGAAQAALWAGWPYYSQDLMNNNSALLSQIQPNSYLGRQLQDISWQTYHLMSPNVLNYNNYFEGDSNDFTIQRHQALYSRLFNKKIRASILVNENLYSAPGFSSVSSTNLAGQADGWLSDSITYLVNMTQGNYPDWHPFFWLGSMNFKPNDYVSVRLINSRSAVEAMQSFVNKIAITSTSINATFFPVHRVILSASYFHDDFSDANDRNGYYGDLAFLISTHFGISADLMVRGYGNSMPNTGNYFSPDQYFQTLFSLKIYQRILSTKWQYYASGGIGGQKIDNEDMTQMEAFNLGIRGPISKNFVFDGYFGYTNTPNQAAVDTTSYTRKFGGISISYFFG